MSIPESAGPGFVEAATNKVLQPYDRWFDVRSGERGQGAEPEKCSSSGTGAGAALEARKRTAPCQAGTTVDRQFPVRQPLRHALRVRAQHMQLGHAEIPSVQQT